MSDDAKIIYIVGPMGSGKSWTASALADGLRAIKGAGGTGQYSVKVFDDCRPSKVGLSHLLWQYDYLIITGYTNSPPDYLAAHLFQTIKLAKKRTSPRPLPDGVECGHPGCASHRSHPCEGCGRRGAKS